MLRRPRDCHVCRHRQRVTIESLAARGRQSHNGIAQRFRISADSVQRHMKKHVSDAEKARLRGALTELPEVETAPVPDPPRLIDPFAVADALGLVLDPWQRDVLLSNHRRLLLNTCRQAGKSTVVAMCAVNQALSDPGTLILVASPSQRQSSELFRKTQRTLRALTPAPEFALESATRLELANGSRIVSLPGSENTVRGFSAPSLVLIDEAARADDELYGALRPMLGVGNGRLCAMSTPWGCRGWFYSAWQHGGDAWARYRVAATECSRISPEFLAEELRELGPLRYASEYECRFVDTEEQFFPSALIERALSADVLPIWT